MASDHPPEASAPLNAGQSDPDDPDAGQRPTDDQNAGQVDRYKDTAARAAAELVEDGMRIGLGTGTTVAYLLSALGERAGELRRASFAATSPATARIAAEFGLTVVELDQLGELDLAIDGADQVDPDSWLIKGGGGAHTREKIVAAAARRFVAIVSAEKLVTRLEPPVPLEVLRFGAHRTLAALGAARLRTPAEPGSNSAERQPTPAEPRSTTPEPMSATEDASALTSPDGNLLAWYDGPVADPRTLAARLSQTPGVVEHGLFEPEMVSEVLIAGPGGVTRRAGGRSGD
jgi:ribose 5-phosphate isomerase A